MLARLRGAVAVSSGNAVITLLFFSLIGFLVFVLAFYAFPDFQNYLWEVYDKTLNTGRCIPNLKVDKEKTMNEFEISSRRCYSVLTQKECASLDFYSEEKQSNIESDGIPDCKWVWN